MTHDHDFFTPEEVDEQVERLSLDGSILWLSRNQQARMPSQEERHLVKDLQAYYQDERREDIASLERAWKRVSPHLARSWERPHSMDTPLSLDRVRFREERTRVMQTIVPERSRERKMFRAFGLLAAVLVAALLVGGLLTALNLSHRQSTVGSQHTMTTLKPTPTTAPLPVGKVIYTTPPSKAGFSGFSWSPDSKRVATIADSGPVIWDATTGHHQVKVHLPNANEWAWGLQWSPNSQLVAIGTNQEELIVDGTTGQVVRSYKGSQASVSSSLATALTGSSHLSATLPASGGFGFRALAWSPDSKLMASSISFGPNGEVQVWNTQTGALVYKLQVSGSYVVSSLAWSSDGKYLAAHAYDTQPPMNGNSMPADDQVIVWNAATHQVVFHHMDALPGSDAQVSWQPRSHNLAFTGTVHARGNYFSTLEIWNVTTGKQVTQFFGMGDMILAWSPDGNHLALPGVIGSGKNALSAIIIIDPNSGQQIYAHKGVRPSVGYSLAWSPDGKYIISNEGGEVQIGKGEMQQSPEVAVVWVA
jgi:WD40 repeat protein